MKPPRWSLPSDLLDYYDRSLDALDLLAREARVGRATRFVGLTTEESNFALRAMRVELDREVSLTLIASAEAVLRVDFHERINRQRKLPRGVREQFKELEGKFGRQVPLDEILGVWKALVGHPDRFSAFQEYIKVRHWLAHGRYWKLKTARRAEPVDVLVVLRELFELLPDEPSSRSMT